MEFFEFALGGTAWGGFWRFTGVVILLGMVLQVGGQVVIEAIRALRSMRSGYVAKDRGVE